MSKISRSKVLVTGGCGFIGTHLVRALLSKGIEVSILDLQSPSESIDQVRYFQGDVNDLVSVNEALEGVDTVFHFAAVASVPLCEEHPKESTQTNLFGTLRVLEAISSIQTKTGKKIKFFFASSSAVYGNGVGVARGLKEEDASQASLLSLYSVHKRNSERLIQFYFEKNRIHSLSFRFFNVYGEGQNPDSSYSGVISKFVKNSRVGLSLEIHGGGVQTRDFISVHDIVSACILALDVPLELLLGQAINLGSGQSIAIKNLAESIQQITQSKGTLNERPARRGDVLHSLANIDLAKKMLGWKPTIPLDQGLSDLVKNGNSLSR